MLQDGLGSIRSVVDNGLGVLQMRHYAPYGESWGEQGTDQTPFGFTGEPTDQNDLVHLRARYYSPVLGVFPSLDPLEGSPMQLLGINRYAYVQGNPINWGDPSGMIGEQPSGTNCQQNDTVKCPDGTTGTDAFKAFGPDRVRLEKIDTSLFASWGIVLTVDCNSNLQWEADYISNLTTAFSKIEGRFHRLGSFKVIFGGLEFRLVGSGLTGAANTRSGQRIDWGPNSIKATRTFTSPTSPPATGDYGFSIVNDIGIQNTIVHELGHVLDNRTGHSMRLVADDFDLPATDPLTQNIGALRENETTAPEELAADHFLNWIYDSYNSEVIGDCSSSTDKENCDKITRYWSGGENPVDVTRRSSLGIQRWLDLASQSQHEWLPQLHNILVNLDLL